MSSDGWKRCQFVSPWARDEVLVAATSDLQAEKLVLAKNLEFRRVQPEVDLKIEIPLQHRERENEEADGDYQSVPDEQEPDVAAAHAGSGVP